MLNACSAVSMTLGISGYTPILFSLFEYISQHRKSLRFMNVLCLQEEYKSKFEEGWNINIDGRLIYRFIHRQKIFKEVLKK